ncbi:MAG: TetR/AcrR family transcriptional regulator [Solirubrobacteraceae bacterium]|jgi:AcrR family transcriptional regulator
MTSPQPRQRNPRGQGDQLRTALMQATRELLLALGDQDKVSVRAVTARAGVSPNALYIHFATKDDLLSAVMTASYQEWRTALNAGIRADLEPIEQLRAYCRGYFQFARERSGIFRVLFLTRIREGAPVPVRDGPVGEDEGVDSFTDFLAIVTRCLPDTADAFSQAAYLWAGLHGRAALGDAIPTFPWPPEHEYIERMIQLHITAHTNGAPSLG